MVVFLKQKLISPSDLQANPETLYIFGDNLARVGLGGQAGAMRNFPNSHGIATKVSPGTEDKDYFYDHDQDHWLAIKKDFDTLENIIQSGQYTSVVIPLDGIGTGLSKLPEKAPKLLKYINSMFEGLICQYSKPV